ncbi:MAG: hypothetical protein AAF206_27075, partial [Bacteroidota bacterium]
MLKCLPQWMNRSIVFMIFFAALGLSAQEICDNALDDDADGLIDLNDPDCACGGLTVGNPISLIPNPSFESTNCCPTGLSQMNCANTWIQASGATSDYYNTCGFLPPPAFMPNPPSPLPDGVGYVGFIDDNAAGYKEYVGACLTGAMNAGTNYLLKCWIGLGTPGTGGWGVNLPFELALFGTTNCANLPFGGGSPFIGCPTNVANWTQLGSVNVNGTQGNWLEVTISFTPVNNINAIVLGPACVTSNAGGSYYYLDNLILADSISFSASSAITGDSCNNNMTLTAVPVPNSTYQWSPASKSGPLPAALRRPSPP